MAAHDAACMKGERRDFEDVMQDISGEVNI
jgi:hypothetical protein